MDSQNHKDIMPYKGLQPYEEENKDIFFGRDAEREILINKIFSNKLTLLFAASGVGKSSLLQAAVLPELKRPDKENLDVVYYREWVSDPLIELKKAVIDELRKQGKLSSDYLPEPDLALKEFFEICSAFSSEPMVVMLDQFEEFFQYRRYLEGFKAFVGQISDAFNDRQTPVVFVISMREDFALELNEFKPFLPTTIFENYFRIEKLGIDKAELAIRKPVEKLGFQYEDKLIESLLNDLAEREKQLQFGSKDVAFAKDAPAFVEPPYLQIVCEHLWNKEKDNPDKIIRAKAYQDSNRAEGIVGYYFDKKISSFSAPEKRIASKAFDHLVTPYGTKMAYPVKDLSGKINETEKELEKVLEKLQKSRILRSQKREGIVWYELYHDIFSKIIYQWNEKYKAQQRTKKAFKISILAALVCLLLYLGYDAVINYTSYHFRLSAKSEISDTVEVYRGKADSKDIFGLQKYEAEMNYERNQIEPDKLFTEKNIIDYSFLNNEMISHFSITDRVEAYWKNAEIEKALELADRSLLPNDMYRTEKIIQILADFQSEKKIETLKHHLKPETDVIIRNKIITLMGKMPSSLVFEQLIELLKDQDADVRKNAMSALGNLGSEKAVEPLLALLKDRDDSARRNAASALGNLGSEKAVEPLIAALKDQDAAVKMNAATALGKLGSEKAVEPLISLIMKKDQISDVKGNAASALGNLGSEKAVEPLIFLIKGTFEDARKSAASALGNIGSEKAVVPLIALLKDHEEKIRRNAAFALGNLGSEKAIEPLIDLLKDKEPSARINAASALGNLGSEKAVKPLIAMLKDDDVEDVRKNAATALGNLGSEKAVEPLIDLLKNQYPSVRKNAVTALGNLGSEKAVEPLIALLKDRDALVRRNAAFALGNLGSEKAVEALIVSLKDQDATVRKNAASALGNIGYEKAVDPLTSSLKDQDATVRNSAKAALENLCFVMTVSNLTNSDIKNQKKISKPKDSQKAKSELPKTFDALKVIAVDKKERMSIRLSAITGLGNIKTEEAVNLLLEILEKETETYQFRAIQALGNTGNQKALPALSKRLEELADRKAEWRKIRDENTDSYTEPQMEDWRKRLESVKPKPYLECELSYAIARIAPYTEGIKLLNHDLAAVREGAWLGIGKVGTVELLRKLYEERRKKNITPWFRHAAYRAIDHVLIHLEAFGSSKDADELEKFLSQVPEKDEPGVHTRTKWTMDRLMEVKNEK